jgi:hypothetical protein
LVITAVALHVNTNEKFFGIVKVLASQKQLENRYKSAKQAADDW